MRNMRKRDYLVDSVTLTLTHSFKMLLLRCVNMFWEPTIIGKNPMNLSQKHEERETRHTSCWNHEVRLPRKLRPDSQGALTRSTAACIALWRSTAPRISLNGALGGN